MSHSYTDNPVESSSDEFRRRPFAERLANLIVQHSDPSSFVISIYGAWGEGKTSALKFVDEKLKADYSDRVVTVWFNPWRYKNEDQLLVQYFEELADALEKSLKNAKQVIGNILKNYLAKLIPPVSISIDPNPGGSSAQLSASFGDGVAAVGEHLAKTTIEDIRDKIQTILRDEKRRVVIFIDDIDRLDREEIASLFRLVKLTANFDYTTFVLAFDDERVAQILGENYGIGDFAAGKSFLEKIVQLPLHLPKTSDLLVRNYCLKLISKILADNKLVVPNDRWIEFTHLFSVGLQPCVRTPRMAKRYANAIAFALPTLTDEVDIVDLMLVEGIRIFYPKLYDKIYVTRGFEPSMLERVNRTLNDGGLEKRIGETLGNECSDAQIHGATELVGAMFPGSRLAGGFSTDRRIASDFYFDRYFLYAISEGDIPDQEIDALISLLPVRNKCSPNDVAAKLERLASGEATQTLVFKLQQRTSGLSPLQAEQLAEAITEKSKKFMYRHTEYGNPQGVFWDAGRLLVALIRKVNPHHCGEIIKRLLHHDDAGVLTLYAVAWLGAEGKHDSTKKILDDTPNGYISNMVIEKVTELLNKSVTHKAHPDFTDQIYFAWQTWGQPDQIKQYFDSQVRNYPDRRIPFLRVYLDTERPTMMWKSDFYEPITKLVDIKMLYELLDKDYKLAARGVSQELGDITFKRPPFSDEDIVLRFKWIHDAANMQQTNPNLQIVAKPNADQ